MFIITKWWFTIKNLLWSGLRAIFTFCAIQCLIVEYKVTALEALQMIWAMQCGAILCNIEEYCAILRNIVQYWEILCNIEKYYVIFRKLLQYSEIFCNVVQKCRWYDLYIFRSPIKTHFTFPFQLYCTTIK